MATPTVHQVIAVDAANMTRPELVDPHCGVSSTTDGFGKPPALNGKRPGEEIAARAVLDSLLGNGQPLGKHTDDILFTRVLCSAAGVPHPATLCFMLQGDKGGLRGCDEMGVNEGKLNIDNREGNEVRGEYLNCRAAVNREDLIEQDLDGENDLIGDGGIIRVGQDLNMEDEPDLEEMNGMTKNLRSQGITSLSTITIIPILTDGIGVDFIQPHLQRFLGSDAMEGHEKVLFFFKQNYFKISGLRNCFLNAYNTCPVQWVQDS